MNHNQINNFRLITIAISHYCEKVRWALDWLNIDYVEENHAPPFHRSHTEKYGGTTVPVLVTQDFALTDSTAILHYLNTIAPQDKLLYPQQPELLAKIEQLENLFNNQLGVATRRWGFYYALQNPRSMILAWSKGVSRKEMVGCKQAFPQLAQTLQQNFKVTEAGKDEAWQTIREIFNTLSQQLKLNQQYLIGDNFSAVDLTLAALAAPILRPPNHPIYSFQLDQLPSQMIAEIEELRSTAAGTLAIRLYEQHRSHSLASKTK